MTMNAFIASVFNYCPLAWIFLSRKLNSRINRLHERALIILYQDFAFSFAELLENDNSATIHNRNIQLQATELFKVKNVLSLPFTNSIFVEIAQHCNLIKKIDLREIVLKRCSTKLKL